MNALYRFLDRFMPFFMIGLSVAVGIALLFVLAHFIVAGLIIGLVIFGLNALREYWAERDQTVHYDKDGRRIIEHDAN